MEVPKRKNYRLMEYDYSTQGAYYITICTYNKAHLFGEIVGDGFPVPKVTLTLQGEVVKQYIHGITGKYPMVQIDKYVIMPDHIHMIITLNSGTGNPSPTIGHVIGWFKYQTTKEINLIQNTAGKKWWQRSYYDHVIRNKEDYQNIWEYIHENPLKWELSKD